MSPETDFKWLGQSNRLLLAQLWVSSVAGTGLTLLLQTIGQDWPNFAFGWDLEFTLNRAVRYAMFCWFACYLVGAYLLNEGVKSGKTKDLAFDVVQSILGFFAFFFLGFVTQDLYPAHGSPRWDFAVPFFSVCIISAMGFVYHAKKGPWPKAQVPRLVGIVSGFTFGGAMLIETLPTLWRLIIAAVGTVVCWFVLRAYWKRRREEVPAGGVLEKGVWARDDLEKLVDAKIGALTILTSADVDRRVDVKLSSIKAAPVGDEEKERPKP